MIIIATCLITLITSIIVQNPAKEKNYGVREFNVEDVENLEMNRLIELATELQKYIGKTAEFHIPGIRPNYFCGTIDCNDDRDVTVSIESIHIYNYGVEIKGENKSIYRAKWLTKILDENSNELQIEGIKW